MSYSRPFHYYLLVLSVLAAFAIRAIPIDYQSLWRDEVDALCYAYEFPHLLAQTLAPETTGELSTPCACPSPPMSPARSPTENLVHRLTITLGGMIQQNGPLYFFLLRGWVALTGTTEYAMRFLSLVFGVLSVSLSYAIGRRLFDRQIGLVAALLVATSPYLIWYSQEVKMYTLITTLALLAVYALHRAVRDGSWHWWAVQVAVTSLAFYSHVLAALLIPVQVFLYLAWQSNAHKQRTGPIVSLICLTVPYLPLVIWQAPQVFQARDTGFYPYTLGEMTEILLNGWSLGILTWGWPWGAALMGVLAIWGLISPLLMVVTSLGEQPPGQEPLSPAEAPSPTVQQASLARTRGDRHRFALVCWVLVPLLAAWFVSLRQPLFTDRYLIWTAPPFYLLVSLGLMSIRRFVGWGRWMALSLAGAILVLNGANLWQQTTQPTKSDFRAAAAYVADHSSPDDLIVFQIPHGRYTFDYYYPNGQTYTWVDGLYTNHRGPGGAYLITEQDATYLMQELTAGHDLVWLIGTETSMWDDRGLVQSWLEAVGTRVNEAHYVLVDVYQYAK